MLIERTNAFGDYHLLHQFDGMVAMLNPLRMSESSLKFFTAACEKGDVHALVAETQRLLSEARPENEEGNRYVAMAITRDLAMYACALTRFRVPLSQVSGLVERLMTLSERTGEVPADTIYTYTVRNPPSYSRRTFTTLPEEELFIESLTLGMCSMVAALAGLETAQDLFIADPDFAGIVRETTTVLQNMAKAIAMVKHGISPELFTERIRPFFEPKNIGGTTYYASNGAQMPLNVLDLILWSKEEEDRDFVAYREHNFSYLPEAYRRRISDINRKPSILWMIRQTMEAGVRDIDRSVCTDSLGAVVDLLCVLMKFRGPHLGVARANLNIRPEGSVGSGGYDDGILRYLVRRTHEVKAELTSMKALLAA